MQSRVRLVIVVFVLVGVGTLLIAAKTYPPKTEPWMEAAIPEQIPGYAFQNSSKTNSAVRMDENTYTILSPFGIVVRQYQGNDGRQYEFVVIAGNTRKSFHDPQVCFSAQNWKLVDPRLRHVNIPTLGGDTPVTVMGLEKPGVRGTAMYFYKDPMGWRHSALFVPFDLTAGKLLMKNSADAQFYRLILQPATEPANDSPQAREEALKKDISALEKFADTMFGKLNETQDGRYFVRNP